MNDKKGFTLIELLAVIAILSILLIIAVTGVLNIYNNIKEESFVVETKGLIRNAKNNATKQLFTTNGLICFDNTTSNKQLDVDGRSLEYYILFNNDGNLINVEVGDQKFYIKASGEKIQQDELGSRKSEKKYITKERKETDILPLCLALNLKKMTFEDSDTRPTEIFTDGNNVYTEDARQTISELTIVPERYGYIFQGYIYEDENGNEYEIINKNGKVVKDYLNKITKETVLKGKWERNIYVVNYDNNGGQGEMSSSTYTYGVSDKLRKNTFTKSGNIFKGWSKTTNGVVEYDDEKEILNLTLEESITLYAVWEECAAGTYSDNSKNVCTSCPAKYYCTGGNKIPCKNGYTNNGGQKDETSCTRTVPAGQQVETEGGAPSACPANHIASKERTINQTQKSLCTACNPGYHSNNEKTACLPDDTTPPTCVLAANETSVYFESKTDNVGVTQFGLDKSTAATFNNASSTTIESATYYGHVKDAAGLTGSCSITIAATSPRYTKTQKTCNAVTGPNPYGYLCYTYKVNGKCPRWIDCSQWGHSDWCCTSGMSSACGGQGTSYGHDGSTVVTGYSFGGSSTSTVDTCTANTFNCDGGHNGQTYVGCTISSYYCATGYTKINDSYCWKR